MSETTGTPPADSAVPPADDLFVSAIDSPTDSGLYGVHTDTESDVKPKTGGSDTMEDLSLQVVIFLYILDLMGAPSLRSSYSLLKTCHKTLPKSMS